MTEKKPCRWGPIIRQTSVLGRFKNKLRLKKLEWKRFYEEIWGPTHQTADSVRTEIDCYQDWETSHHSSEGSNYDHSQYFDSLTPEEVNEQYQQAQIFTHYQSAVPVIPSRFQQEVQGTAAGARPSLHNGPAQATNFRGEPAAILATTATPWMDPTDSFDSGTLSVSEFLDTDESCADWWQLECSNMSTAMSVEELSTEGHMPHMDVTRDTGDSSSSAIPTRPEDRLLWVKKFLDIGAEEALDGSRPQGSRSWRAMVRLVCACKKLSTLLWMRRSEKEASEQAMVKKRCRGFGENRSLQYKGVRRRNGKWVSEIRVGQTNEKVWLGSFDTEKEAALAFDAGKFHCSAKRNRSFNFPDSPRLLGPPINLRNLSPKDRKITIQRLAEDHAKAGASTPL